MAPVRMNWTLLQALRLRQQLPDLKNVVFVNPTSMSMMVDNSPFLLHPFNRQLSSNAVPGEKENFKLQKKNELDKKLRAKTPIGKLDELEGTHPYQEKEPLKPWPDGVNPNTGEIGGPKGPEPTRYGDWERKGRVTDF